MCERDIITPFIDDKSDVLRLDQMLSDLKSDSLKFKSQVCDSLTKETSRKLFNFWAPVSSSAN